MIAPTWCFFRGSSNRNNLSTTGIKKAKVFPLPVTALTSSAQHMNLERERERSQLTSTTTSLCAMNSGIAEAWTGVMRFKPMLDTASMIHSAKGGLSVSQARDEEFEEAPASRLSMDEVIAKLIVGF